MILRRASRLVVGDQIRVLLSSNNAQCVIREIEWGSEVGLIKVRHYTLSYVKPFTDFQLRLFYDDLVEWVEE